MKKKKINKRNLISLILIILFSITLLFSLYKIIKWNIDNNNTKKIMSKIDNNITKEVNDSDKTEIINNNEELSKSDPYWDYIKMNMIDVEFDDLKKINKDVVGWIKVNGTNINYPFVQTSNNDYYLNHSFDKSSNGGGWVFLDYRNNKTDNKNTIIYGHGRQNKTIFGTLKNILNNGWLENEDNYIIKISTEKENTLWQIFSVYRIPTTSDYLQTEFISDEEYDIFLNMLLKRSQYNFKTAINKEDKILTLSTCYNNDDKVVVHAKLIKRESK